MLEVKRETGTEKNRGERAIRAGEAVEAQANVEKSRASSRAEGFLKGAPGKTVLEGAVPGIFLLGIFSQGMREQLGEPELNGAGDERREVALLAVSRSGGFDGFGEEEDHGKVMREA